jgi:hypothetical protein
MSYGCPSSRWFRAALPLASVLLGGCSVPPSEVAATSDDPTSDTTTTGGPTSMTTPGTTMPGEDTMVTQGGTGMETTVGAVDTTMGVSATDDGTTTVEPSTSSSSGGGGESSSSGEPPPECVSDDMCGASETCSAEGACVSVCMAWGDGHYDYCLTPLGTFNSTVLCGEALSCINAGGMNGIEVVVCGVDCATQCDCPPPPATGNATVSCGDIVVGGTLECYLACAIDADCPTDMVCRANGEGPSFCAHPVQPLEMYGNCGDIAAPCISGNCAESGTNAVCVSSCPGGAGDCDPAPAGADFGAACGQVFDPPAGNECHLPCGIDSDCPSGMVCIDVGGGFSDFCMFS